MTASALVALALTALPCAPVRELPRPVRGVVLSLHDADPGRSYEADVAALHALGANAISIMPTWYMATVRSATVSPGNTTLGQLEDTLATARSYGLQVLVAPVLQIEQLDEGEWRGVLAPPDWDDWFSSYRELLLETARIAERNGASALLVGSELCSSERMEGRWRALIADVRRVFAGSLAYQANWDHREVPEFFDALDILATNAYFELRKEDAPMTLATLVAAWRPFRDDLLTWAEGLGKPLLVTEIGYPSLAGGTAFPWDYTRATPVSLEEQELGYEAMFEAWSEAPQAAGLFVYEWWGAGGGEDRGYTFRGKPAEAVLRRWLAGGDADVVRALAR